MLCTKCYSKTKVESTTDSVIMNIPHVTRSRVCPNKECKARFKTIELPETIHMAGKNEPRER